VLTEEGAGIAAGGDRANLNHGVTKQQAEHLSACITGSTCHRSPYSHPHEYAMADKLMHFRISRAGERVSRTCRTTKRQAWSRSRNAVSPERRADRSNAPSAKPVEDLVG
jgi:hypothetical protein